MENEEVNKIILVHGPKVLWALAQLFIHNKINCFGDFECRGRVRWIFTDIQPKLKVFRKCFFYKVSWFRTIPFTKICFFFCWRDKIKQPWSSFGDSRDVCHLRFCKKFHAPALVVDGEKPSRTKIVSNVNLKSELCMISFVDIEIREFMNYK